MQLSGSATALRRRRFLGIVGAFGIAATSMVGISSSTALAAGFPVPSPINVTNIKSTSFDLQVGRVGAIKYYEYSATAPGQATLNAIIGTTKATLTVHQNTDYALRVRQVNLNPFSAGPFSAPITVHIPAYVAPAQPTAPGSLQVVAVTGTSATLSWTPSSDATFAASTLTYRYFLDGKLAGTGRPTGATIDLSSGTTYRVEVDAVNPAGVRSNRASATVTTSGAAVAVNRPTAPANIRVIGIGTSYVSLDWDRSSDPLYPNTSLLYRIFVDGVPNGQFDGYQSCQYCFDPGFTGGGAIFLSPSTTYTIGIVARNPDGSESALSTIIATTNP